MTSSNEKKTLVTLHIQRAKNSLQSSRHLLELNLLEDAVSRAYYAVYHSAYAILLWLGYTPRTHKRY